MVGDKFIYLGVALSFILLFSSRTGIDQTRDLINDQHVQVVFQLCHSETIDQLYIFAASLDH